MIRLLLDTNVVIWLLLGRRDQVPPSVVTKLEDEQAEVLLSAVCPWEIAVKRSSGKLELADEWPAALRRLPFSPLAITAEHAVRVGRLPLHHRDPFDRMLVAQAQCEDAVLVTADRRLAEYDLQVLW